MTIAYADKVGRFTLQINGETTDSPYGFEEVYDGLVPASEADIRAIAADLCGHRANLLPSDHKIYNCRYSEIGTKFATLPAIDSPVEGKFPGSALGTALGTGNTTLVGSGSMTTNMNTTFTMQSSSELSINDPSATARFKWQGEGFSIATRHFHGVPDFFCSDAAARKKSVAAWYGVTAYVQGTVTAVVDNWWNNFEPFFSMVKSKFRLVRKPGTRGVPVGSGDDATKKFALCPITHIKYDKISSRDVGGPFGLSVGARLHR